MRRPIVLGDIAGCTPLVCLVEIGSIYDYRSSA